MKAVNTLAPSAKKERQTFSMAIKGDALQSLIRKCVPTAADAARLTGALTSAVAANQQLQNCSPASIVAAALRGEGMQLTYGMDYHLVPYGEKCQYILGYKGLLHLLIATGEVADTNCIEVVEGEYKGRNKHTKRPEFDFSIYDTPEAEAGHPVIGYYFYVTLRNGYTASEYMRIEDILAHAQRYSQTFDRDTYTKLMSGGFAPQEIEKIKAKSPWYSATDTMMRKTVIRKLLNSGFVPLANSANLRAAINEDGDTGEGEIISADVVDTVTGEVVSVQTEPVKNAPQDEQDTTKPADVSQPAEQPKRGRKPKETNGSADVEAEPQVMTAVSATSDDAVDSFFDGGGM